MLEKGYGIMPNTVLFDKDVPSTAKLVFVLISSLCAQEGYCWATNSYIGDKLGVSKSQVNRCLTKLNKYIECEMVTSEKRRITLRKNAYPPTQKSKAPLRKNAYHNITKNITNKNIYSFKTPEQLGMPDLGGYGDVR